MDEKFKTSFIPKQPLVGHDAITTRKRKSSGGGGLFFYLAVIAMFLSLLSWGAMFVWSNLTDNSINKKTAALVSMQEKFRPADIAKYKLLHERINVAVERLQSHRVVHPVFGFLSTITLPEVQYTSFTYEAEEKVPEQTVETSFDPNASGQTEEVAAPRPVTTYKVTMDALADSYETIAAQSRLFKGEDGQKAIRSSSFSDFKLDDETRMISFKINATLEPKFVSYLDFISRSNQIEVDDGALLEEVEPAQPDGEEAIQEEPAVQEETAGEQEAGALEDEANPNE